MKLYVGNLSYAVEGNDLQDLFEKFGPITEATLIKDPNGRSKGFGFVAFQTAADANTAIETLHDKEFRGRKLIVSVAKDRATSPRPSGDRPAYRGSNDRGGNNDRGNDRGNSRGGYGGRRDDSERSW